LPKQTLDQLKRVEAQLAEKGERQIWKRRGLFGNAGIADSNPSPFRSSASIGLGGSSLLRDRKYDTFGAVYYYLEVSDSLKNLAPNLLPLRNEQGVELFYNRAVTRWCHTTPDLQVVTPARSQGDTVLFFGLRAKIDF